MLRSLVVAVLAVLAGMGLSQQTGVTLGDVAGGADRAVSWADRQLGPWSGAAGILLTAMAWRRAGQAKRGVDELRQADPPNMQRLIEDLHKANFLQVAHLREQVNVVDGRLKGIEGELKRSVVLPLEKDSGLLTRRWGWDKEIASWREGEAPAMAPARAEDIVRVAAPKGGEVDMSVNVQLTSIKAKQPAEA